ncbi:MAG: DUF3467 domain-containing protein [Dehalococcoidia bacterium]
MATRRGAAQQEEFKMPDLIGNPEAPTYAPNQIRILTAVFDVTLLLGQIGIGAKGTPEMHEICRIQLSPQHAKALAKILSEKVQDYERDIGEISLGPDPSSTITNAASGPQRPSSRSRNASARSTS